MEDRKDLTLEQRSIFKVPVRQRQQMGLEAMTAWIQTAEILRKTKLKNGQTTLDKHKEDK